MINFGSTVIRTKKHTALQKMRALAFVLIAFIALTGIASVSARGDDVGDDASEKVGLKYEIGMDATSNKILETVDVSVTVANNGGDFSGTVQLSLDSGNETRLFEKQVNLPAGSRKVILFRIPQALLEELSPSNDCTVTIRKGNKNVAQQKFDQGGYFFTRDENSVTVGLLSDHPNQLSWIDNGGGTLFVSGESKELRLLELDEDLSEDQLAGLTFLVIDDFDTSVLSTEQIEAIQNWVNLGGGLWIGTGARPETISGFDQSFIDATVVETVPGKITFSAIEYGPDYQDVYTTGVNMILQCSHGAVLLSNYGLAEVMTGAEDGVGGFFDDGFGNSVNKTYFAQTLLSMLSDYSSLGNAHYTSRSPYNFQDNMNLIEERIDLHFTGIRLLMLLYVILVGPLLYLILKSMQKREKIWIVLPAVSAVFVGLVFLLGIPNRVNGFQLKSVSVCNADGSGNAHTFASGYHSSNKDWTLTLKPDYYSTCSFMNEWYSEDARLSVTQRGERLQITYDPDMGFSSASFLALGKNHESGSLIFREEDGNGLLSGSITNQTGHDLYYVCVMKYGYGILFRDVKNGETVSSDDLTHIEEKDFVAESDDALRTYASDYYYKDKYEQSRHAAALVVACEDKWQRGGDTLVIGVTDDAEPFTEEQSFSGLGYTCLVGSEKETN
ncbi:MAG: hypothetical protein K6E18_01020 [Lachnospiraceae bacterium]|nr:hypothetical protein [Lachnospiraceae bacterium]